MKKTLLKITSLAMLTAALAATTASSRAADTSTNAPAAATPEPSGPAKFYGPITAVDASAKTFTVGDQTFSIIGESQVTKDGKPATLADAAVGEPARGSYTKGKDGKLNITKVRFGKAGGKSGGAAGGKSGGKKKKDAGAAETNTPAASSAN
jgi:hypothetical protein